MNLSEITLGLALGVLGAAANLALLAARARMVTHGAPERAMWMMPLSMGVAALTIYGSTLISSQAAWSAAFGLLVSRGVALAYIRRRA